MTGVYAGEAGFADYRRQVEPAARMAPEAGWVVSRQFYGKGYGSEIARAIVSCCKEHFGQEASQCCLAHPEHAASLRVPQKCGFLPVKALQYKGNPVVSARTTGLAAW